MFFKKVEKRHSPKTKERDLGSDKKNVTGKLKNDAPAVSQTTAKQKESTGVLTKEKRPGQDLSSGQKPKQEPFSVIETWTKEDMVKGIVLSEVLGPPKSKRKK